MEAEIEKIINFCIEKKVLETSNQNKEYFYSSLPLCVIDSIFSIGVNYKGVQNVIKNVCEKFIINIERINFKKLPEISEQISVSDFKKLLENQTYDELANNIFKNRQRTSTVNGILKAEAVIHFLDVLIKFQVEYFQDVEKLYDDKDFESEIKQIKGQSSGISLKYFFMLAGNDNLIKPDRMILRFISNILKRKISIDECQPILVQVSNELLKLKFVNMNPKLLDNRIWNYQRDLNSKNIG